MEKQLVITLKGEGKHADSIEFNLEGKELSDFFDEVAVLIVLNKFNKPEHRQFKASSEFWRNHGLIPEKD